MVVITVIMVAVIAASMFGMLGDIKHAGDSPALNETITIVDKVWDGNSGHFGHVTTLNGSAYRVHEPIDYMRLQMNHTYNVEMERWFGEDYFVITKINNEVLQDTTI